MGNLIIRKGRVADLPEVLELIKELAEHVGHLDQVKNSVEQMEIDGFGPNPVYGMLVAERDDVVLGVAIFYYRFSTWKGKRLYLEDFVVKEAERSKGIGKLLFDATLKKSLDTNCSGMMWQVIKENKRAIDFYKRHHAAFDAESYSCNLEQDQIKRILSV